MQKCVSRFFETYLQGAMALIQLSPCAIVLHLKFSCEPLCSFLFQSQSAHLFQEIRIYAKRSCT